MMLWRGGKLFKANMLLIIFMDAMIAIDSQFSMIAGGQIVQNWFQHEVDAQSITDPFSRTCSPKNGAPDTSPGRLRGVLVLRVLILRW
jgi:hypothetical protein